MLCVYRYLGKEYNQYEYLASQFIGRQLSIQSYWDPPYDDMRERGFELPMDHEVSQIVSKRG